MLKWKKTMLIIIGGLFIVAMALLVNSAFGEDEQIGSHIGEGGYDFIINQTTDIKQEVKTSFIEINQSILEITIDNHDNSTTGVGYKWDMALCNKTGNQVQYMEEDTGGGFDNAHWIDLVYGKLIDFGMDSGWCGEQQGYGFVLFSSGSKNQFPKNFRLMLDNVTSYDLYSGTGSAIDNVDSGGSGLDGLGDKLCKDLNGNFQVTYQGPNDDLIYANSSDNGLTWTHKNIYNSTISHPTIVCGSGNNITIIFGDIPSVGFNKPLKYVTSDNNGATFSLPKNGIIFGISPLYRTSCDLDSNGIIHCIAYDTATDTFQYTNSTHWGVSSSGLSLGEQQTLTNDTDQAEILIDSNDNGYVIGCGSVADDLWIWESADSFATKHLISGTLGNCNENIRGGNLGASVNKNGTIVVGTPMSADHQFCISTTSTFKDVGGWDCQETSALESRATDIAITLTGDIHSIFANDNLNVTSEIMRTNTSDDGLTFEVRTRINVAPASIPHIASTYFPASNRLNGTLDYIVINDTIGIDFYSYLIREPLCEYLEWGDWVLKFQDNCVISDFQNVTGNTIKIIGDNGFFRISSTGVVWANQMWRTPDDFDGDSDFIREVGSEFQYGRA